ncbi:MAG: RsmB/NOP family class I SAM-dependent RNA methyltransferase [Hyphomicrobiaceae bacterium]
MHAASVIVSVLSFGRAMGDAEIWADRNVLKNTLIPRDRAQSRMIATTVLRRTGEIEAAIEPFLDRPLPSQPPLLRAILYAGAAQLMFLETPAHAAINIAVEHASRVPETNRFDGLINALLRKVAGAVDARSLEHDPLRNIPDWLMQRWIRTYGEEDARRIAEASLREAALDITVKSDPEKWAAELGGIVLPTGTVRTPAKGRIDALPGFSEGEWWVQDAAAALPARLLGDVAGLTIADLCAAPGGKTADLVARGAKVTAVDISLERLGRVRENLSRLKLSAEVVEADAGLWLPEQRFDAVLLDVPCTATGTIRRHPDILRLKRSEDIAKIVDSQARLLRNAIQLVKPGGLVVYCTCSLEPEEGVELVGRFLAGTTSVERVPIEAGEAGIAAEWLTPRGELRTLPFHMPHEQPELAGLDGFYAVRLRVL